MGLRSRRDFLKACAVTLPALASAPGFGLPEPVPYRTPEKLERYLDPLPRLTRLKPESTRGGRDLYRLRMVEFRRPLHSQLPPARLWGYEGQYPGPLFDVMRGRPIEVVWENHLPEKHLFGVDTKIHGAMAPAPAVRTVPHLHGARTPSASDGLPEKWFRVGESVRYFYPNEQAAATLWYHDHALGITRLNVYAGLSGMYLLRDAEERKRQLPSGEYEVPLILQDRTVDAQGQLVYQPTFEDGTKAAPAEWAPEFFGALPVVNGVIYPHLEVEPRPYRLRLLNSSNSRFFRLYLNLAKSPTDVPEMRPFHQIGTDGGLLPAPVKVMKLLLGPAERADLIVDFSGLEGRTVTLSNDAASPYPGWAELNALHAPLYEPMQFRVTLPKSSRGNAWSLPAEPPARPKTAEQTRLAEDIRTRDFVLAEQMDAQGRSLGVRIDGKGYDDPVTEIVELGTTERWRFINTTDDAHPMHLHLIQFRILERQGYNQAAFTQGKLQLVGVARPPAEYETGWKDTAVVNPGEVLSILAHFAGYTGRYVFHCHMLEHEDNDMMRPYEVVNRAPASRSQ